MQSPSYPLESTIANVLREGSGCLSGKIAYYLNSPCKSDYYLSFSRDILRSFRVICRRCATFENYYFIFANDEVFPLTKL